MICYSRPDSLVITMADKFFADKQYFVHLFVAILGQKTPLVCIGSLPPKVCLCLARPIIFSSYEITGLRLLPLPVLQFFLSSIA